MEGDNKRLFIPRKLTNLRNWLIGSQEGSELLREAAKGLLERECRRCHNIGRCPKVLAVIRRLGCKPGVEVYHEPGVSVRIEELVDSQDDVVVERLLDDLLRAKLPRNWKHLVECRSDSQVFSGLSVEDELRRIEIQDWLWLMQTFREWRR